METPIYKMLKGYGRRGRFHTPGHKGRLPLLKDLSALDITELSFSDNLLSPHGILGGVCERLAERYSSDYARMLTCGATCGLLSMLSCFAGKTLLVPRCSHKSVYNALDLFRIEPIFLCDVVSRDMPVVSAEEVKEKIDLADGILITYPDYYGRTCDIAEISRIASAASKPLLVDSAHGGHFAYSSELPENAAKYADICVFGVHKTCLALTGSAVICAKRTYADAVDAAVGRLHSTSPSYLLCCSIDISDAFMLKYYGKALSRQKIAVEKMAKRINRIKLCRTDDPAKLVADVTPLSLSGFSAGRQLEHMGIYPEMCDAERVVFILTAADGAAEIRRIGRGLSSLKDGNETAVGICFKPKRSVPYTRVSGGSPVTVRDAVGRVSACNAGLYPPGVPLVTKGETVTAAVADELIKAGDNVFGVTGGRIEVI